LRYPLVGGTRERHFAGINFKPRKTPENAQTPTSRVHAVLGGVKAIVMRLQRSTKLRSPSIQEYGADHGHHMIQTIAIQGSENVYADRLNR
jgi:hypothetical protein